MTDLIKSVEVHSIDLLNKIKQGNINIKTQIDTFIRELNLVKVTPKSKFIIFGNIARELYDEYFEKHFPWKQSILFKALFCSWWRQTLGWRSLEKVKYRWIKLWNWIK